MATWERLAHVALSGSGDTVDSGTFTAYKNLKFEFSGIASGDVMGCIRFNSDNGNNYSHRRGRSGTTDGTGTSTNLTYTTVGGTGTNDVVYAVGSIVNNSDKEKLVITEAIDSNTAGAGNAPQRREAVHKWANTSDYITSIQMVNVNSGSWDSGSYITVWGASDDVVTDEKTTLTNVPVNTRYEETDTRKIFRFADETNKTNITNYWKMDSSTNTDTATTANGYTNGLGKNGTNTNITVDTSDKKIGTASYEFNGSSSKCTYGSVSDWKFLHNGDAWSATFWMKLDSLAGGEILGTMAGNSGSETGMHIYVHPDSNGMWTMQVFAGSSGNYPLNSNVSSVFATGTWNHYACTFDGSTTYTVYKDGVSKGTMTKGSPSFSSSNSTYTLHMGDSGGNTDELDGNLDDFAIWNTELSASFIKTLAGGSPTDNLTGWKERNSA